MKRMRRWISSFRQSRGRRALLGTLGLLLFPLGATLVFEDFRWDGGDFLVMGGMLFPTLWLLDWIVHRFPGRQGTLMGMVVLLLFLLLWAELAVGIFGTHLAGD